MSTLSLSMRPIRGLTRHGRFPVVCRPRVTYVYTPHSFHFLTDGLSGACPSLGSNHKHCVILTKGCLELS